MPQIGPSFHRTVLCLVVPVDGDYAVAELEGISRLPITHADGAGRTSHQRAVSPADHSADTDTAHPGRANQRARPAYRAAHSSAADPGRRAGAACHPGLRR